MENSCVLRGSRREEWNRFCMRKTKEWKQWWLSFIMWPMIGIIVKERRELRS